MTMTAFEFLWIAAVVGFFVSIAVWAVIGQKCPNCGRRKTIRRTGKERPSASPGFKTEAEWICRACGTTGWTAKARWTLIP